MGEAKQPKPAQGQLWYAPETGHTHLLGPEDPDEPGFFRVNDGYFNLPYYVEKGWRCIGVEAPAGRVMVGERRAPPHMRGDVYDVIAVRDDGLVDVRIGANTYGVASDSVAQWPRVGPLATAAKDAFRATLPISEREATFAAAARIAKSLPVSYDSAIRAVEYYGSEDAARMAVASLVAGGCAPPKEAIGKPRSTFTYDSVTVTIGGLKLHGFEARPDVTPKPDPRAEIEQRRRDIDAVLREDARRFPAFATARRAFVLSSFERSEPCPERARGMVAMCHTYERKRGGATRPSAEAAKYADGCNFFDDYERARGLP